MRLSVDDSALRQMVNEYCEMPGLRLTPPQGGRLWHMTPERATTLLNKLVELRFLVRTTDGRYARRSFAEPCCVGDLVAAPPTVVAGFPPSPQGPDRGSAHARTR